MNIKKYHIFRKSVIIMVTFSVGIVATVFAAISYDANIQSRSNTILDSIKSNASKLASGDTSAYYSLVRLNIKSLMQVLALVDEGIAQEQGSLTISDTTNTSSGKDCKFSLKPYFDLGFKTTFYANNNKTYSPNSLGDMTLPGDMMSDFYIWKDSATNPQFYFRCAKGVLTVSDKDMHIVPALPGVIVGKTTTGSVTPTPIVVNNTREQELFQKNFENCYTEYRISSCAEFMGTTPKSFSRYTSPGNTGCNANSKADDNGWTMNYFEEKISNTDVTLRGWGCSVMSQGGYCRKGTTIEVSPETIKKEIGTNDPIGSEGWSPGRNSWYADKFTPAATTDSCYTKANEKMYYKDYYSQAFEPSIKTNRVNDEKGQFMEWTTKNVEKLTWKCKTGYGRTMESSEQGELPNHDKYYMTWEDLHKNNWTSDVYMCTWILTGNGKTHYVNEETFVIK